MIEEDLDEALQHQARKEGTSKAALIRRYVAQELKPAPGLREDPLWDFVGSATEAEPVNDIDEFLYGPVKKS